MGELRNMMMQMQKDRQNDKAQIEALQAHNKQLENQLAQLATSSAQRQPGHFPSQPAPHQKETVNAITLRSGASYSAPSMPTEAKVETGSNNKKEEPERKTSREKDKEADNLADTLPPPVTELPFPNRVNRSKSDYQFSKFLNIIKDLQVTVPFTELITQVPSYAKFLKDLLKRKQALSVVEKVAFTEECSVLVQDKSPPKLKDPGSFSIPCNIGPVSIENALCDLGASVSIMPLSVCKKLDMGVLKCTNTVLEMADRSYKHPMGVMENVLVKIGKFFVPVDFVVVDMTEDSRVPIILGRPFLNTAGAVIDVNKGILTLKIGDDELTFHLNNARDKCSYRDTCYRMDIVDSVSTKNSSNNPCEDFAESLLLFECLAGQQDAGLATFETVGRPPDDSKGSKSPRKGPKPTARKKGRAAKKKDIEDPSFSSNGAEKGRAAKMKFGVKTILSGDRMKKGKAEVVRLQPPPVS